MNSSTLEVVLEAVSAEQELRQPVGRAVTGLRIGKALKRSNQNIDAGESGMAIRVDQTSANSVGNNSKGTFL